MKIAAMAAGAVGGYFGARMQAAGHDVSFIARGAHLDASARTACKIESVHGDLHLPKVNVTDDPAEVGPVDIVLFAVKLWDTETAARGGAPAARAGHPRHHLAERRRQLERIAPILGADRTVGGAAYIAAVIAAPGVIRHTSSFATMRFGRVDEKPDAQLAAFVDAAKAAKLDITSRPTSSASAGTSSSSSPPWPARPPGMRSPIGPMRPIRNCARFFRQADGGGDSRSAAPKASRSTTPISRSA